MTNVQGHLGELALRRHRAGEPLGNDAAAHVVTCAECRSRGRGFDDEQRRFEHDISFDRFAAGVERAARGDRAPAGLTARWRAATGLRAWMAAPAFAAAAAAMVLVMTSPARDPGRPHGSNGIKGGGGAALTVRVAASGGGAQRTAAIDGPEALAAGERMRIGYEPGPHRYVLALSIDDQGVVTPLYPESGRSVAVAGDAEGRVAGSGRVAGGVRYLPDSVELTGKGAERIVVVLSDRPVEVDAAARAARAAYARAKGDIMRLPELELAGEQFHRTFRKP